jgi:hypothetical protein
MKYWRAFSVAGDVELPEASGASPFWLQFLLRMLGSILYSPLSYSHEALRFLAILGNSFSRNCICAFLLALAESLKQLGPEVLQGNAQGAFEAWHSTMEIDRFLAFRQRVADPSDDRVPTPLFRCGIVDQHAIN